MVISHPKEGVRDCELVWSWLKKYDLYDFINNVTNTKNKYSTLTLDDRAITFDADYMEAYQKILIFKPYWEK